MPGTNITMVGVGTGGAESGLAQIDVPLSGNIIGVFWTVDADLDADAEVCIAQLSFGSSYSGANDARQVISVVGMRASLVTAAGAVPCSITANHIMSLPVQMGERLYLHGQATAGVGQNIRAVISFDFDLDRPLARRR